MKNNKKVISVILGIIGCILFAAAAVFIIWQMTASRRSQDTLEEMREAAEVSMAADASAPETEDSKPEPTPEPLPEPESGSYAEPTPEPELFFVDNPYRDSFLANEDMAAWLKIDGTEIDYPVMWTPRDENYYLYRGFEGNDDKNGCLILDTDSSLIPLTTNLIIHGHNMRSGAMFGKLTKYEDEDYYRDHKYITLYTEDCQRDYEVIAVFRSQVYRKSDDVFKFYKFFQANTREEFDDFYRNIKALSQYDTGVTAQFGDHFITLSTCVYHVEQGRFVVVAKEISSDILYTPFRDQGQ